MKGTFMKVGSAFLFLMAINLVRLGQKPVFPTEKGAENYVILGCFNQVKRRKIKRKILRNA